MATLGIAIPCYKPHWHLIPHLLKNIETSTRLPDKVVISCSSWDLEIEEVLTGYTFPVFICFTTRTCNAAQNRNRAADKLDTDLISFMDADDRMNPRRLEIITNVFERHSWIEALYHSYVCSDTYECAWDETTEPEPLLNVERNRDSWTSIVALPERHALHHAHVTIRRGVFKKVRFVEDEWAYRIEDGIFARQLLENSITVKYIPNRLSLYLPAVK